jgi:hypothetical protein
VEEETAIRKITIDRQRAHSKNKTGARASRAIGQESFAGQLRKACAGVCRAVGDRQKLIQNLGSKVQPAL